MFNDFYTEEEIDEMINSLKDIDDSRSKGSRVRRVGCEDVEVDFVVSGPEIRLIKDRLRDIQWQLGSLSESQRSISLDLKVSNWFKLYEHDFISEEQLLDKLKEYFP